MKEENIQDSDKKIENIKCSSEKILSKLYLEPEPETFINTNLIEKNNILPNYMFTGHTKNNLNQWDIKKHKKIKEFHNKKSDQTIALTMTPNLKIQFSSTIGGDLIGYCINTGDILMNQVSQDLKKK